MLAELAAAALLVAARPRAVPAWAAWTLLALVGVIWASTFLVQVPAHGTLARGFDEAAHARLVGSNWIRTAAWTARALLLAWLAAGMLAGAEGEEAR
jgi:hypothetical protein